MRNKKTNGRRVLYIAALIWAMTVFAMSASDSKADGPAPGPAIARFEIRYMEQMIDHHAMGVMMAALCEEKAIHEDLIEMCHNIAEAQMEEIALMQGWLADRYDIAYVPQMKPGDMMMTEYLAFLEGEDFEIVFMEMMSMQLTGDHHGSGSHDDRLP